MLHRLETADHRLDARTHLFVLLQQVGTFRCQHVLALLQRFVLVLELITHLDERVHALLKALQFQLKGRIDVVGHKSNIVTRSRRINRQARCRPVAVASLGVPWDHWTMDTTINHDSLDAALRRCGASWDAAQTHGLLSGRLAVAGGESGFDWLSQVLDGTQPNDALRTECERMLSELFEITYRQLAERQSEFEPLLPDDQDGADVRAAALAHWCEGFLHGLVSADHSESLRARLAEDPLADIIRDMLQITRAGIDDESDEEAIEDAYAELVEYLRVATQLAYEELVDFRRASGAESEDRNEPEVVH